jgi:hypothetical protein
MARVVKSLGCIHKHYFACLSGRQIDYKQAESVQNYLAKTVHSYLTVTA